MNIAVQQMADRVAELMEARLRIKGEGLSAKLKRGRRYLPRKVLAGAEFLAESAEKAQVPHLQTQLDHEKVALAYDTCVRYLKPLGRGARRRAIVLGIATSSAFSILATVALVAGVLIWRGLM
jgi:hypothetical protein